MIARPAAHHRDVGFGLVIRIDRQGLLHAHGVSGAEHPLTSSIRSSSRRIPARIMLS
jgi:hypothetical protein